MNSSLTMEFWETADQKWRFWRDLEYSLTDLQPLMVDDLEGILAIMYPLLDLFKVLEVTNFKNGDTGRNCALEIISNFISEQANGSKESED